MTVKEVMKIGCEGMNADQLEKEQERRLKVCERINKIGEQHVICRIAEELVPEGSVEKKNVKRKMRKLVKTLNKIKAQESVWLKEAGWFLYC